VLPGSLALLLLSAELRAIARLGRTALTIMTAGMFGIALGGVAGFFALRPGCRRRPGRPWARWSPPGWRQR
jgi:uncharacterized membrane protein